MKHYISCLFLSILLVACKTYKPVTTYEIKENKILDYSLMKNWASHPDMVDPADKMPEGGLSNDKDVAADVFFLHPTTYTGDKGQDQWNADIDDQKLNQKTDEGTILFQASAFNQAGRIFAPRYRQAHLQAYFTKDTASAVKALDFAYQDIKNAFEYYLTHENKGRPIIIAAHSQGTNHAERILTDFFDGKALKNKLIAAYLIGMPIQKESYKTIKPCLRNDDTGCFVSWRTFKNGHEPKRVLTGDQICVTNPLSWCTNNEFMPKSFNKGSLLFEFNKVYPQLVDAQIENGVLWANKPKFKGSFFLWTKNYHIADINFYYMNIRENASERVKTFMKTK
ncbi:MAG: DUF3089 domain-containing protein [Saprospiraceae bacterium]|nr:DUF3089 domain-containing protein [Saprospiraceae bacterium]